MKEKAMRKYNAQMKINEIKIFVRGERGGESGGGGGREESGKNNWTRFFHVIKMFSSLYYQFF